jgi:glycosyltransferase 2 family protein
VLGGAGLWLSLRGIPLGDLRASLASADLWWSLAALTATLAALAAVVARWRLLLRPASVGGSLLMRATLVGQMLNVLLPFRLGEVARVYGVTRHSTLGLARVTTSLAIEKALDLAIFAVASAALVATALVPRDAIRAERWLVLPVVVAVAFGLAVMAVRARIGSRLSEWLGARGPLARRIGGVIGDVANGLDAWRSAGHAGSALAWTVLIFALAAAANQWLLHAFAIDAPATTGVALLVVLQAGSVPPSLPGRLGIYNYLTVLTLGLYGVNRTQAATYSIALYLIAYAPKLVLGALVAADPSWRPSWSGTSRG